MFKLEFSTTDTRDISISNTDPHFAASSPSLPVFRPQRISKRKIELRENGRLDLSFLYGDPVKPATPNGKLNQTDALLTDERLRENPAQMALAKLFVMEHNLLVDKNKRKFPTFTGKGLFQKARRQVFTLLFWVFLLLCLVGF